MRNDKLRVKAGSDNFHSPPFVSARNETFMDVLKSDTNQAIDIREMPQSLISEELMQFLESNIGPAYKMSTDYIRSFLIESSKFKGFLYSTLAHELGSAVLECLQNNNNSGNCFLKRLKWSGLNLLMNYPRPIKQSEEVL